MAPTKDIIITIPTLEGIVAALMLFHRTVVDCFFDYNILLGCAFIFLSFYIKRLSIVDPSPDSKQDEDAAPRYQSYGTIQGTSDHVKSDGIKQTELGSFWRVLSWVLLIGGIFIMIPTD